MRCAAIIQSLATCFCLQSSLGDAGINYCGARMCAHTDAHTYCRYPPGPHSSCVGYADARLSDEERVRVLARLNRRRGDVARGVGGLPPAADMLRLRWVEELAREAQRWADQCRPPSTPEYYDSCRDLYSVTVGQCVASVVGEAPGLRSETVLDVWLMQRRKYRGCVTNYTLPENTNNYYGDFAQMFWARAYMVGCGRSRFMTPWHGRLRSVERLVCNFAPRGPAPQQAVWTPGTAASACPARSRPDVEQPYLCSYHYNMDETYDEDNTMALEEHLLLNTVLEIERNVSLDHIGSMDELYLTKLAVATIDAPIVTYPTLNFMQKRNVIEKLDIASKDTEMFNESDIKIQYNAANSNVNLSLKKKSTQKKVRIIGRPKTYDIDDLNDSQMNDNIMINNYDKTQETTTVEKEVNYDDYDIFEMKNEITIATTASTSVKETSLPCTETAHKEKEESSLNSITVITEKQSQAVPSRELSLSTEAFGMFLNAMMSNLSLPEILNESAIDPIVLDDYLSDPETVRQLQEALNQMEKKAASLSPAPGKVRRELRNLQNGDQNTEINLKEGTSLDHLSDAERNKSLDRGPMLSMVLKYMPYLKPYEKSIIGTKSGSVVISPSYILFIVLYL